MTAPLVLYFLGSGLGVILEDYILHMEKLLDVLACFHFLMNKFLYSSKLLTLELGRSGYR